MKGPKLPGRLRAAARLRHHSPRTEDAYAHWAKHFILFHHKRHPADMGADEAHRWKSSSSPAETTNPKVGSKDGPRSGSDALALPNENGV